MKNSSAERQRYSPERAYRPLVSPPSVEDKDACALYASVRRDATPSHEPITLALESLQKMLHRAGNVDGEGDGCGLLVDIPTKVWAEEVRQGGHNPALALDDAFAVAHVFVERSQDLERIRHDAREILGAAGFRILAERLGAVDSAALGPTAREEEPQFWQFAGLVPEAADADRTLFNLKVTLEEKLGVHVASFSGKTAVYKVMGNPKVLGSYYADLSDERMETIGAFGHNRYSTNTWPSFTRVQPFGVLGHNGEINTIEQLRQEARMLGVPIGEGDSDSQDLNRTIESLVRRHGLSLAEAMEMVVPPIVDEIAGLPDELHSFYMYLRQTMGPFAQGPVALIARHMDECVFSADAMGLRPLWKLETPALALRSGDFLVEFREEDWAAPEAARVQELSRGARGDPPTARRAPGVQRRGRAAARVGPGRSAAPEGELPRPDADALAERPRTEALRVYQRLVEVLSRAFQVPPSRRRPISTMRSGLARRGPRRLCGPGRGTNGGRGPLASPRTRSAPSARPEDRPGVSTPTRLATASA